MSLEKLSCKCKRLVHLDFIIKLDWSHLTFTYSVQYEFRSKFQCFNVWVRRRGWTENSRRQSCSLWLFQALSVWRKQNHGICKSSQTSFELSLIWVCFWPPNYWLISTGMLIDSLFLYKDQPGRLKPLRWETCCEGMWDQGWIDHIAISDKWSYDFEKNSL